MTERLTTAKIRRDINRRKEDEIFTTRAMLQYGARSAVDSALYNLVKDGTIRRLARGVFVRGECKIVFEPVVIAIAKAKAFGKRILFRDHQRSLFGLPIAGKQKPNTFIVEGHSSSFQYGTQRIFFKMAVARKFALGETLAGTALRLLWWHKADCTESVIASSRQRLGGQSRSDVRTLLSLLPEWLHNHFLPVESTRQLAS